MRLKWKLLAGLSLLVASSCSSPLSNLRSTEAVFAGGPTDAQLVFRLEASNRVADYNYTADSVGYLVVRLEHQTVLDGTKASRSAAAEVVTGTATINLRGMAGGPWTLLASLYDDDGSDGTDPNLLFTARQTVNIVIATSTTVNLLLYKPGDLSELELIPADLVDSLLLSDTNNATEDHVPLGDKRQLSTVAYTAANAQASEQRVVWSSDNPAVAQVNSAGLVVAKSVGKALITATSVESEKTGVPHVATYTFWSEPTIYGRWRAVDENENSSSTEDISIYRDAQGVLKFDYTRSSHAYSTLSFERFRGRAEDSVENWHLVVEEMFDFEQPENGWVPASELYLEMDYLPVRYAQGELAIEGDGTEYLGRVASWTPLSAAIVTVDHLAPVSGSTDRAVATPTVAASIPWVFWLSSNHSVATIDVTTGAILYLGVGSVTFTAYSVENPTLAVGTLNLEAGEAPSTASVFTLASGAFGTAATLVQVVPDKVNVGKWLVAGYDADGVPFYLRLNNDGSQDNSFAGGGSVHANASTSTYFPRGIGVYQDASDGSVFLTTYHQNGIGNTWISRFDGAGTAVPDLATSWSYVASSVPRGRLIEASDGNLYQLGWYNNNHFLWKIANDGTPTQVGTSFWGDYDEAVIVGTKAVIVSTDSTWRVSPLGPGESSIGGFQVSLGESTATPAFVAGAAVETNSIVLLGKFTWTNPDTDQEEPRTFVVRINLATGYGDPTFGGSDGFYNQSGTLVLPPEFAYGSDLSVAPDGTIYVAGNTGNDIDSATNRAWVVEISASGRSSRPLFRDLDPALRSSPVELAVDASGKVMVVGFRADGSNLRQPAIWSF